jgi:hypothetical protein
MPYRAGLEEAKQKLASLEQARQRSGASGDSSHYALARDRLIEKIELFERLTANKQP